MAWQYSSDFLDAAFGEFIRLDPIILASVLVAGAVSIGWVVAARLGSRLHALLQRWLDGTEVPPAGDVSAILRYALISALLLVAGGAAALGSIGQMVITLAAGVAVGMLVWRGLHATGLGRASAAILALAAFGAAIAGTLGGMQPVLRSLDAIGFSVGDRRFSLLVAINAVVVAALLYLAAKTAIRVLDGLIRRAGALDVSQQALVQKLAAIGVIVIALLLGIDLIGIDLTALAVFSGAAGLAIGFGLQKTFGNLIAGLILLMDRSVKPGDVIVVGDTFGAVSKIGVRAVSVVTRDGKEHLIPNEQLMTEPVENWSYSSRNVRIHIPVGVAYGSDIALAQRLMVEAAMAADRVLSDPKPSVWLKGFGDNSVDHDILVWITDPEQGVGNIRSDILNRVWVLFADHDIEIPFPQRDVHIRSMPAVQRDETEGRG